MKRRPTPHRGDQFAWLAAGLVLLVYLSTAARDIVFGDGLELCAVAATGGVAHPPGYPLYTTLAQGVLFLVPRAHAYMALAWLNSVLGATTALLFGLLVERILREEKGALPDAIRVWLPGCAVLLAGFSLALWGASTVVEVYVLNALLTLVFHRALASPGDGSSTRRVATAACAVGLLAANHLPGLAVAPLLIARWWSSRSARHPARRAALGLGVAAAIAVLLALSLTWRAAGDREGIFWGEPRGIRALATHLQGGEYGQFQLLQERPGVPFTPRSWGAFAKARLGSLARDLNTQFGPGIPLLPGVLVLACVGLGGYRLGSRDPALAAACAGAGVLQLGFLLVYNIPDFSDYEVGLLAVVSPLVAHGLVECAVRLAGLTGYAQVPARTVRLAILPGAVAVLGFAGNLGKCSPVRDDLPRKWLANTLEAVPPGALLITHGDADTYALWYAQHVERSRRDITVYGANFHRFGWFARTIPREAPLRGVVGFSDGPPPDFAGFLSEIERLAIAPATGRARIFSTLPDEPTFHAWTTLHDVKPVARLVTDEGLRDYAERNPRGFISPILLEITPRTPP